MSHFKNQMPLKVAILVKRKTSKQKNPTSSPWRELTSSLIAVCLIELLIDSSEKNRPNVFIFVTELLHSEGRSQQVLNQDKKKRNIEFNDAYCTNIFWKEGRKQYLPVGERQWNVSVNEMCPGLYFIHQFYATKQTYLVKDLFKNIAGVLGEEKYASTTYAWYI